MAEKKERRYSVDFEHFENAMLTEANLGWQVYKQVRWQMPKEQRAKVTMLLKRFVTEMKSEVEAHKERYRKESLTIRDSVAQQAHPFPNGD